MFELSAVQILIVLAVALLVFGPKRLPELGRQLGRGLRELKGQMNAIAEGVNEGAEDSPARPAPAVQAATASDDDVLDGVVVSGATPPDPPRPPE